MVGLPHVNVSPVATPNAQMPVVCRRPRVARHLGTVAHDGTVYRLSRSRMGSTVATFPCDMVAWTASTAKLAAVAAAA